MPCDYMTARKLLIDELRRPQPNYNWQYPSTCAMGIACNIGLCSYPTSNFVAVALGLTEKQTRYIFMNCSIIPWWNIWKNVPSCKDIARALEKLGNN